MSNVDPPKSDREICEYRTPLRKPRRSRVPLLLVLATSLPFIAACCIWSGARAAQHALGQTSLQYPPSPAGRTILFWLETLPLIAVTVFYIWTAVHAARLMLAGHSFELFKADSSTHYPPLLLAASILGWILFIALSFPIWDEISP